ncbi:MAG: superoxide dismutase [Candidatus Liptonbacteria bacterium]|nr:superoxide dismutase [Candidatus Liptonbacteria bacterium]
MKFELPKLPYGYDALEPFIDANTMEIHHAKHHQAYVNKLNEALAAHPEINVETLESLLMSLDTLPQDMRTAVRNHGGGHFNHSFFWTIMAPPKGSPDLGKGGGEPEGALKEAIAEAFGDFNAFKAEFAKAATGLFGSGWTWLTGARGSLVIMTTPNQDSPVAKGAKPLLGLDVWEHAYYLKYQNKRADYIEAFWNVVNWAEVGKRLGAAG